MPFKKGHKTNLGRKYSEEHRRNLSVSHKGQHSSPKTEFKKGMKQKRGIENPNWKEEVTYTGIHAWVKRYKGQPTTCEKCGKTGLNGKRAHWANIDHKYKRVLDDYIRMCVSCHQLYDFEMGFRKKIYAISS